MFCQVLAQPDVAGERRKLRFLHSQVRVSVIYVSCDPTQLNWSRHDSFMPAVPIGEVVRAAGMGIVEESKSDKYAVGEHVG